MHHFRLLTSGSRMALAWVPVLLLAVGTPTDAHADETQVTVPVGLPTPSRLKPGTLRRQENGDIVLDAAGGNGAAAAPAKASKAKATATQPVADQANAGTACPAAGGKPATVPDGNYKPQPVNVRNLVIWGARALGPEGSGLSFGGVDQRAADGRPHTCLLVDGTWVSIVGALRRDNPLQGFHDDALALAARQKRAAALSRYVFFEDLPPSDARARLVAEIASLQTAVLDGAQTLMERLDGASGGAGSYERSQISHGQQVLRTLVSQSGLLTADDGQAALAAVTKWRMQAEISLRRVAEFFAAEPPARALSPIAYDQATGLYVLFGGDHFDYLRNDLWVFDPAARRWMQRHPDRAPPPRANHRLTANGNGTVTVTGGYRYTSATGYLSHQYATVNDGQWQFDLASNSWRGMGTAVAANIRTYRTGVFDPVAFLQPPYPDRTVTAKMLAGIPPNTWIKMKLPVLPQLNRDWGRAALDPDRGLMLRWSGGHSAHGGTDVLQYHLATNRWELPLAVEFPLGQLYSNTSYPRGVNFNRRPWISGHTYNNYGYDSVSKRLVFTGKPLLFHLYDPLLGDWTYSGPRPAGMKYRGSFYNLTVVATPDGLFTWGRGKHGGRLFRYLANEKTWREVKFPAGAGIPDPATDNSSAVYDSKRNRILFLSRPFKRPFNGLIYAVDLSDYDVNVLTPAGRSGVHDVPFLARGQYDRENDLVVFGTTLEPDVSGVRRLLAYDPERNRWVSLEVGGADPIGDRGRNVSLGFLYDPGRRLFWATDLWSHVYVMRLEPESADMQPLD